MRRANSRTSFGTTRARILVTTNLPGFLPVALKLLDEGAVDTVLVGDDAEWGASSVADPLPIPERDGVVPPLGTAPRAAAERLAGAETVRRDAAAIHRRHHRLAEGRDAHARQPHRGGLDVPPLDR